MALFKVQNWVPVLMSILLSLCLKEVSTFSINERSVTNSTISAALSLTPSQSTAIASATGPSSSHLAAASTVSSTSVVPSSATTTDGSSSTCIHITPSPTYWFPDWAFQAAYNNSNPCKYDYCRSSFDAKFPNSDALGELRKTITGVYVISTIVQVTTVQNNQTSVTNSTKWIQTEGATTLSSLAAWWGNSWNEPCCDVCHISAGTIDLRYWPTSPPTPDAATVVENGFTYIYPSIYWVFNTIGAQDGCSAIGGDHSNQNLAFDPSEIFSVSPVPGMVSGSSGLVLNTYSIDWEVFYQQNCSTAAGYSYSPNDPGNENPWVYDPCHPYIAIPPGFATMVDPAWTNCINDDGPYGYYDPPWALIPQSALVPNPTPTDRPFATIPAVEQSGPAPPTSLPTAAPAPPPPASSAFAPQTVSAKSILVAPSMSPNDPALSPDEPTPKPVDPAPTPNDSPPPASKPSPTLNGKKPSPPIPWSPPKQTPPTPAPPPLFTINSAGALILPSTTLLPGGPAFTLPNSQLLSIATDRAIYVGNTLLGTLLPPAPTNLQSQPLPVTPPTPLSIAVLSLGSSTLTALASTLSGTPIIIVGPGTTLSAGSPATTIHGVQLSVAPNGGIILGGTRTVNPSPLPGVRTAVLTIGASTLTAVASSLSGSGILVLAPGTTLVAGAPGTVVGGVEVSVAPGGAIVLGGTKTVTPAPVATDNPPSQSIAGLDRYISSLLAGGAVPPAPPDSASAIASALAYYISLALDGGTSSRPAFGTSPATPTPTPTATPTGRPSAPKTLSESGSGSGTQVLGGTGGRGGGTEADSTTAAQTETGSGIRTSTAPPAGLQTNMGARRIGGALGDSGTFGGALYALGWCGLGVFGLGAWGL